MKNFKTLEFRKITSTVLLLLLMIASSCNNSNSNRAEIEKVGPSSEMLNQENEEAFINVMQKHLDAVSDRDLVGLKETMDPNGHMQLILPKTEIIDGVDGFMEYHKEWFADPNWTFETKILNTEIGQEVGMAITEIVYKEPNRKPDPYFNRMIVSYDLKKMDGQWYIIKDHASSIEKSTDSK